MHQIMTSATHSMPHHLIYVYKRHYPYILLVSDSLMSACALRVSREEGL